MFRYDLPENIRKPNISYPLIRTGTYEILRLLKKWQDGNFKRMLGLYQYLPKFFEQKRFCQLYPTASENKNDSKKDITATRVWNVTIINSYSNVAKKLKLHDQFICE